MADAQGSGRGGGGCPPTWKRWGCLSSCLEMWISNSGLWMESRHYFLPTQLLPKTSHAPSYCVEYSAMKITVDLLFRCLFYSSANFWATSKLACNADLIQPWLITSAKKRQNPCSRHPTGSTNYQKCVLSFLPTWLANWQWVFKMPTMLHTQILVHSWGPRKRNSGTSLQTDLPRVLVLSVRQATSRWVSSGLKYYYSNFSTTILVVFI